MIGRKTDKMDSWASKLENLLPALGHRNWIVIADAAYPAQANPGIETIATEAEHLDVLKTTLDSISKTRHVKAKVYVDAELHFVAEQDAPGVTAYRHQLARLVGDLGAEAIPHEEVIAKLDQSARLFRILILKSDLAIPYTTVFLELDCKYWNLEAEARLRSSMAKNEGRGTSQKTASENGQSASPDFHGVSKGKP